ncbi:MAG: hypothetical protein COZ46_00485 [Verrucomicrobia bacterium CG_4_10_14_3_um_filter_43_23]|nr:MAG: hypothetical protein AUJ82_04455 [Verrucomicrobia bacterium CG1_02_43_26]PIP59104.1 MAG: hypothetical protein COX01_05755 [Verrucomicrobia bacterium CG22_combo_CG10-13_8_21_14_all_43_17]PIX59182.1 MAG: hypothetical protein COZ46_00485 [Verrucomicrobia bacterium CG_4_10_14_3_um_filter_43_23]PIY61327.1 MAG: hypothetical protein COY94_05625 [Verrucomicrobia bacterium CG_4_10_14_0_8_um_filter_43_34]PJA44187.1 MAG: hypothetical protein CO175_04340 [Verrucomicrobia bacterium CG_4_9_14_3_um_fi
MDNKKLISKGGIFFDLLLTAAFFVFMTTVCIPHVPAQTETMRLIFGIYGSTCLTGVFWLALQLFRVTRVDYARSRKNKS